MTGKDSGKTKVLMAKLGLDGHDRGAKAVVFALRDAGFEVVYTGRYQTPEKVANAAMQEDADVIGVSILSGAHLHHMQRLASLLKEKNMGDRLLIVGGMIPDKDFVPLKELGVRAIFTANSRFDDIVAFIREHAGR
ncbi:MAG: cobalamin B12-binding domain-containing protein [Dehalococcoidia bacterium]|nr:cobalamin B12-binding domain-containing protein [Dehalococcoidia bacterium]